LNRTHNSEQDLNENLSNTAKANPMEIIAGVLKAVACRTILLLSPTSARRSLASLRGKQKVEAIVKSGTVAGAKWRLVPMPMADDRDTLFSDKWPEQTPLQPNSHQFGQKRQFFTIDNIISIAIWLYARRSVTVESRFGRNQQPHWLNDVGTYSDVVQCK